MTDETPDAPKSSGIPKVPDQAIDEITKALIGTFIKNVEEVPYGDSPLDKIRSYLITSKSEKLLEGVADLSAYLQAQSLHRQAKALESIAASLNKAQLSTETDNRAQAIVNERESKLEYLSITYSFDPDTLALLWAIRGILMDASIKSLSRPDRFDPYRRVSTETLAHALRLTPERFISSLPRKTDGPRTNGFHIDYDLLEDFDIMHYGGTTEFPDEWIYGG